MKNGYVNHYWPNVKLATPVVLAQAGQMLVSLADTLMVGRVGTTALAAASFANSIFINILVFGMGVSFALTPLVGKAFGGGNEAECRFWLKQGVITNLIIGVVLSFFSGAVVFLMPFMGQEPDVYKEAIPYFWLLVLSIIPLQVFSGYKQFAEGLSNTKVAMVLTIGGNLLNVGLNYVFIYGHLGSPALGLLGAGIGTFISRVFMALAFMYVFQKIKFFKKYRSTAANPFSYQAFRKLLKLGVPMGIQFVIEVFAFSLGSIMMGWIDAKSLAAHQIVLSIASLTYMMSSGLASATTIKVSIFRGMNRFGEIKHSALASIHLVLIFMTCTGIAFVLLRHQIPQLFISEMDVVSIAAGLMVVAGLFQIFDGIQVVGLGILRGMEDVVAPVIGAGVAYLALTIPLSYFFAFTLGVGPVGIWIGYLIGLASAGVFLMLRFRYLYLKLYKVN